MSLWGYTTYEKTSEKGSVFRGFRGVYNSWGSSRPQRSESEGEEGRRDGRVSGPESCLL